MDDLIEALQIFAKYTSEARPCHCEHDVFQVKVDPAEVSDEDTRKLEDLSFCPGEADVYGADCFVSFRFGKG